MIIGKDKIKSILRRKNEENIPNRSVVRIVEFFHLLCSIAKESSRKKESVKPSRRIIQCYLRFTQEGDHAAWRRAENKQREGFSGDRI